MVEWRGMCVCKDRERLGSTPACFADEFHTSKFVRSDMSPRRENYHGPAGHHDRGTILTFNALKKTLRRETRSTLGGGRSKFGMWPFPRERGRQTNISRRYFSPHPRTESEAEESSPSQGRLSTPTPLSISARMLGLQTCYPVVFCARN